MSDTKLRQVNAWTYRDEDEGGSDSSGYWEEWDDKWDGRPTHMLVPVEVWERVVVTFQEVKQELPKLANEAIRGCDHILEIIEVKDDHNTEERLVGDIYDFLEANLKKGD